MRNARISIPNRARVGEVIEIKTLITHPMESGFRRNSVGQQIPRDILTHFSCAFNDKIIFEATLQPGIAANPYLTFHHRVTTSGRYTLKWTDQHGETTIHTRELSATPTS